MNIPIEIVVAAFTMLAGYFTWNFRALNKILKQQLINSVRLHNIEQQLGIQNPFAEERLTNE